MRGFFAVLVVLLLVVVGLGFYLEWWGFTKTRDAEGKATGVNFNVNRKRIAEDAEKAGGAIRNLGKKVQQDARQEASRETAAAQTVKGTVTKLDAAGHRLTVKTPENREVTVQTGPETKVRRNEVDVRMNELMEGDHVVVQYRDENGNHIARSITVEPGR